MNPLYYKFAAISFLLLVAGCAHDARVPAKPSTGSTPGHARVQTAADAIAVVRRELKRRGGDPNAAEYSAGRSADGWFVMTSAIADPAEARAGRYPPPGSWEGFTVSDSGKILATMPGL